jgi:hypothetical protein
MNDLDFQPDDATPERLAADLSELYDHGGRIPAEIDRAILHTIRSRAASIRRMRLLLRWGGGAAAAAAMVLVALRVWPSHGPAYHLGATVTILDAFSLARQIKSGAKIDKTWDANGDGVIDQKDVDLLANRAVSLAAGGTR